MSEELSREAEEKKRCCEQSFLARVAGLNNPDREKIGPVRRAFGLILLIGVHLHLLAWSLIVAIYRPRYRKVARFQLKYFFDVIGRELRGEDRTAP